MAQLLCQNNLAISSRTEIIYHVAWQLYSWALIPEKWKLTFIQNPSRNVHSTLSAPICESWEEPKGSVGEWLNKHGTSIHTMEHSLDLLKNKILIQAKYMTLKCTMRSGKSQSRCILCDSILYTILEMRGGEQISGCQQLGMVGGRGVDVMMKGQRGDILRSQGSSALRKWRSR